MKYTVKQRVFSFGAKYDVWDTDGNPVYHVRGEILSLGRVLHIYDTRDNEVATVEQRLFTFGYKYDVYCGSSSELPSQRKCSHLSVRGISSKAPIGRSRARRFRMSFR